MVNPFNYSRRPTVSVKVGDVMIGSEYPVRLQSMTNTPTLDTEASVAQCRRIADAGADIVRLTAQGVAQARNMGVIRASLRGQGYGIPLVADIHFNPAAAFAAAEEVEKVRINPGNFADPGRTFRKISYTDDEYAREICRIRDRLVPFLELCREKGTALRIGVNHGSLSDRIMSRYGDTPAGMVESAMEFLRVCVDRNFTDVVISIKASNVTVMVETVRRMVAAMDAEDMHFPLHLGVTEAGDGEDGRVKSAVGIGALLADGIGDTIRVSLSEAPENEIPVARMLVRHFDGRMSAPVIDAVSAPGYDWIAPVRRTTGQVGPVGAGQVPVAVGVDFGEDGIPAGVGIVTSSHPNPIGDIKARFHEMMRNGDDTPIIIKMSYPPSMSVEEVTVAAGADFGALLLSGFGDGIWIDAPSLNEEQVKSLSLSILQATRQRMSKTEYIACPGCGRTLFDLQSTLRDIKAATSHLRGLKIGVMGCVVNGPGEMADADYGYVGAAAGNVSLYKGRECVKKNIPAGDALPLLIDLIKSNGDWRDEDSEDCD